MIMYRILAWIALCAFCFTSCQTKLVPQGPWVKKIDAEDLSRLMINFSVKLKREHHLNLEDSWVGYDDFIEKMCVRFSSQRLLTVEEARLLIVEVVEGILYRLNNHSTLSFQLEKYPFTANDLDVRINFNSFYGRFVDELYIGLIWLKAGCVHFYAFDRKDPDIDWDHHRFEPYFKSRELALLKVEAELAYADKEGISNKVNLPAYERKPVHERYEPYSPSKVIRTRLEEYNRPQPMTFIQGRDLILPDRGVSSTPLPPQEYVVPDSMMQSSEIITEPGVTPGVEEEPILHDAMPFEGAMIVE